jgi:hypothetical protein
VDEGGDHGTEGGVVTLGRLRCGQVEARAQLRRRTRGERVVRCTINRHKAVVAVAVATRERGKMRDARDAIAGAGNHKGGHVYTVEIRRVSHEYEVLAGAPLAQERSCALAGVRKADLTSESMQVRIR